MISKTSGVKFHVCPKGCKNATFITVAHVAEDWVVDAFGNFIEEAGGSKETVAEPNNDNIWECRNCGAEAELLTGTEFQFSKDDFALFIPADTAQALRSGNSDKIRCSRIYYVEAAGTTGLNCCQPDPETLDFVMWMGESTFHADTLARLLSADTIHSGCGADIIADETLAMELEWHSCTAEWLSALTAEDMHSILAEYVHLDRVIASEKEYPFFWYGGKTLSIIRHIDGEHESYTFQLTNNGEQNVLRNNYARNTVLGDDAALALAEAWQSAFERE